MRRSYFLKRALAGLLCMVLSLSGLFSKGTEQLKNVQAAQTVLGDINQDGAINANDAMLALMSAAGLATLHGIARESADVFHDGIINAQDALLILQYAAKIIHSFEEAQPKPEPAQDGLAAPSNSGKLHVEGTKLVGENNQPVQLRGISTHGIAWFPQYLNEACFRQLRQEWKANVVRLAMYTAEYGGYCSGGDQAKLKKLIDDGVNAATRQDLYVIIDWHILSDGNPGTSQTQAKAFFQEVSAKYKEHNNVLYEICNEPNGGTSWQDIKAYANEVIPVIRANDPDAVIIVGTPNWSQYVDQAAEDPITGYSNLMYTLHFYAATHTDALRNTMVQALNKGLPVFVTEFGLCDASGNGAINDEQSKKWISLMDQYGISYVAWSLSNKDETCSMIKSTCTKTSGFTASDLSASGTWIFQMLTGGKSPSGGSTQPADSNPTQSPDEVSGNGTGDGGKITYTAKLANHWESDGKEFKQYVITVQNTGTSACGSWSLELNFSGAVTFSSGWNADYTVNGSQICITPMDYNKEIPPGGSVGDVGFIVSGNAGFSLINQRQ